MAHKQSRACIIAGSSHIELARQVSKLSKIPMIETEMEYFANGEIRPIIRESVRDKDVYLIQAGYGGAESAHSVNDFIIETVLLIKTLKRSDAGRINLVLPFFPYSRQDKKDNKRGAISARDIADMFESAGVHRVITIDLHASQIQGFFNIPCDNLYTAHLIKDYFDKHLFKKNYKEKFALVAPDEGALKRMREYAGMFGLPLFVLSKERDYRKKNEVEKTVLIGEGGSLAGRTAIVIDDMIDTFGTIAKASELLQAHGAGRVIVAATHGLLSGPAIERINNSPAIDLVLVSDTISQHVHASRSKKIHVYPVASMLAEAVQHLEGGKSLPSLYVRW